jgi:hypothetical protein
MESDERKEIEQVFKDRLAQSLKENAEKLLVQNTLSTSGINVEQYQRILKEVNDLKQKMCEMDRNLRCLKSQVSGGVRKWV